MRRSGSFTLEAVFVVSISVYVLFAIIFGGFYAHDSLVMESAVNGLASAWLSEPDGLKNAAWSGQAQRDIGQKLWLMDVTSVSVKNKWQSKEIRVKYTLPISFGLVKRILSGGKSVLVYETERENRIPAEYIWEFGKGEGDENEK